MTSCRVGYCISTRGKQECIAEREAQDTQSTWWGSSQTGNCSTTSLCNGTPPGKSIANWCLKREQIKNKRKRMKLNTTALMKLPIIRNYPGSICAPQLFGFVEFSLRNMLVLWESSKYRRKYGPSPFPSTPFLWSSFKLKIYSFIANVTATLSLFHLANWL